MYKVDQNIRNKNLNLEKNNGANRNLSLKKTTLLVNPRITVTGVAITFSVEQNDVKGKILT